MRFLDRLSVAFGLAGIGGIGVSIAVPLKYPHIATLVVDAMFWGGLAFFAAAVAILFIVHLPWRKAREGTPAASLEIIFDVANPAKRFWSRILTRGHFDAQPTSYCDEYRVLIRNRSEKTIRNVSVSREANGYFPTLAEDMLFQKDGKRLRDLDPGRSELVNIFWVHPPQAGDAWGETARAFHGSIKVMVSGEDVPPAECEFDYCPDELPALVRR
jgi:hypothetical protein